MINKLLSFCCICHKVGALQESGKVYVHYCGYCSDNFYYCSSCTVILLIGIKDTGDMTTVMLKKLHEKNEHSSVSLT